MTRLTTLADAEAVADRAAVEIVRALQGARREHGVAHLALSGGTTPARTYELLASAMADWDGVEVWFADERCVGPHDEESNYRLAHETLLRSRRHPPRAGPSHGGRAGTRAGSRSVTPARCAEHVAVRDGDLPVLDLIVLGIGPDGHVASLFPGAPTLDAGEHALCLGVHDSPKPPPERITLSLAVLRAARAACCWPPAPTSPTRSPRCSASRPSTCPRACCGGSG